MKRVVILLVILIALVAGSAWWYVHHGPANGELVLYGNIDFRQAEIAFHNNERIAAVLAQEGDRVRQGQVLARLDTRRLDAQVAQADAQVAMQRETLRRLRNGNRPEEIAQARAQFLAQQHIVEKLHHGSRPEEIAQMRANVESAKADALNARQRFDRADRLMPSNAISRDDYDAIKAALDMTEARLVVNQKLLELAIAGPRKEEIAEAEARLENARKVLELAVAGTRKEVIAEAEASLQATEAQAAYMHRQLADAALVAPMDAVVRSRIMEPGEMASPQKPVFSLAITDPKWVRAYVTEPDLCKIRPRMKAWVSVDSFPDRRFEGWIGFISPVAEFTPKTVQTDELRTSLVFEVRVFVKDPGDELRLGTPATVRMASEQPERNSP